MSTLTVTQIKNLENLAKSKEGLKFTPVFFPYTSGQIGNYFIPPKVKDSEIPIYIIS